LNKPPPVEDLITKACVGDAEAQYRLAHAFLCGQVEPDESKALHWLLAAAAQGHAAAENDVGTAYLRGVGAPPDPQEATRWYRRSAEKGNAVAAYNLAMRYLNGHGARCAPETAAHWLAVSAERGYTEALTTLGRLHLSGTGVRKCYTAAAELLTSAAAAGDASASRYIEPIRKSLEVSALNGCQTASVCLGRIYAQGLGRQPSAMNAYAWYRWATKKCRAGHLADEATGGYRFFLSVLSPKEKKRGAAWLNGLAERTVSGAVNTSQRRLS
jgi:uncharacterized protein